MESPKGLKSLPAKVRLEWMLLPATNALAYYDTELITSVKGGIVKAPGPNAIKICRATLQITLHIVKLRIKA